MSNRITAQDVETLITLKLQASNTQILLAEDGMLKATTPQRQTLTIVSLLPQEGSKAKFVLPDFQNCPHRFMVCTEDDGDEGPVQWVFPEMCFTYRGVTREDGTAEVDLDLPGEELDGWTIRDGLYFLEERWGPNHPVRRLSGVHASPRPSGVRRSVDGHGRHTRAHLVQRSTGT